jgi:murein DD-endopeptidase MepM/ murein hydrolase activator NlpD
MSDNIIGLLSSIQKNISTESVNSLSKNSTDKAEFYQLLTGVLSATSFSGSDSETSVLGNLSSTKTILMPLMLCLFEKMMADQVNQEFESSIPDGMPIAGTLTQSYHSGHQGLDFGAPEGTPVQSTMSGKVVYAGWNDQGYGNLVIVQNGDRQTYYGHLSEITVENGQELESGTIIGLSGNTGNSTGPHLHYEVRVNNTPVDPTEFTLN